MEKGFNPKFLSDFRFHNDIINRLIKYKDDKIDNLIFFGVNNSGKKTLVNAFINHIFKTDVGKQTKLATTDIKISNNNVTIEYLTSPYHFEINLYEFGYYDRNIITDFIQDLLSYSNINIGIMKIIVINHFDKISKGAQLSLRRIIEKTCQNGRFILICENLSAIDSAIKSRFSMVRVPKPSKIENISYIKYKLDQYSVTFKNEDITNLVESCKNDLYKINLQLEHIIKKGSITETINNGNIDYLVNIIPFIEKKDLKSMNMIRENVYKLLLINIEPPEILRLIAKYYMNNNQLDNQKKMKLITIAASCDKRICKVDYNIIVLEYFILQIKKLLLN